MRERNQEHKFQKESLGGKKLMNDLPLKTIIIVYLAEAHHPSLSNIILLTSTAIQYMYIQGIKIYCTLTFQV